MAFYTITSPNTALLSQSETLIYTGKNGFTTLAGVIPVLCNNISSVEDSLVLTIADLNLLQDANFNTNVLEVPSLIGAANSFVRVPTNQYANTEASRNSTGFFTRQSSATLEILSYNVQANTITVNNPITASGLTSNLLPTPSFYIELYQPLIANSFSSNTMFITGSKKTILNSVDLSTTLPGSFLVDLKTTPLDRKFISLYIDDVASDNFTWLGNNYISIPITGDEIVASTETNIYVEPAIEVGDAVSFSTFNSVFSVVDTSYVVGSNSYSSDLTNSKVYTITLSDKISSTVTGDFLINISSDLEGKVGNLTSNTFTLDYDDSYVNTYRLANSGIYYLIQKSKLKFTTARPDQNGKLLDVPAQAYLLEAASVNRYNRLSTSVRSLLGVSTVRLGKISSVLVTERIFIDTTSGASINATIEFPKIRGRDVLNYEILYRVVSQDQSSAPDYTRALVNQPSNDELTVRFTISSLDRGPAAGSNKLELLITPTNGSIRGYPYTHSHDLIGKLDSPAGLRSFNVGQQQDSLIFSWDFAQTEDGYILDLDTKEVEIREYVGSIDLTNQESVAAAWSLALIVDRVSFPNTTFTAPVSRYGEFTYLIRTRDTSNNESDLINAAIVTLDRSGARTYKAYNEAEPDTSFSILEGQPFPNSNVNPELSFPSFSEVINGGLVMSTSANADNANGSSSGFSVYSGTENYLTSGDSAYSEYITQIRDVGKVIRGTVRIKPIITIDSAITFNDEYRSIVSGVSDSQLPEGYDGDLSVLVDNAFSGLGHLLGFNNANAAATSYNSFHRTLTSGGPNGNVYAILNPGQFVGDTSNANSYALIAGVLTDNAIRLGTVFFANGQSSQSNNFANLTVSGNSYQLIDLAQYSDAQGAITYLGPTRSIVQNVYVRYATDNVYYSAEANGVVGYPYHGNVNQNSFVGASSNSDLSYVKYVAAAQDFRYFQIKLSYLNKAPLLSSILLENLQYEVDVPEKTFTSYANVSNASGVYVDYSFKNFVEVPVVTATVISGTGGFAPFVYDITEAGCNVKVTEISTGTPVATESVNIIAVGI